MKFCNFEHLAKVVFKSKRHSPKIWTVMGDTNWRPNHILLSTGGDDLLHPYNADDVRLATQQELEAGKRLESCQ